ncbi:anaphase promoting complex subunit 11 [Ilyonectria robusta]
MKVTIKKWNTVATWRWDIPEDDVCGICQVHFDGTCPTCKYPGDDCSLCKCPPITTIRPYSHSHTNISTKSIGEMRPQLPYGLCLVLNLSALPLQIADLMPLISIAFSNGLSRTHPKANVQCAVKVRRSLISPTQLPN